MSLEDYKTLKAMCGAGERTDDEIDALTDCMEREAQAVVRNADGVKCVRAATVEKLRMLKYRMEETGRDDPWAPAEHTDYLLVCGALDGLELMA